MAIRQRAVGAAVGGASVGLAGAEVLQHADHRDLVSQRTANVAAGALAATSIGLTAASLAGVVPLSADATGFTAGVGIGSSTWYVARETGVAPRITLDVPDEVNVAGPLVTAFVLSSVGIAVGTIATGIA